MYVNRMTYGTRRRGEAFPAILSDGNTVAWFDSTLNVTKDGSDFVSAWGDKSGLSHDLLQATGTNQPLWSANGVLFDGIDNFMKCVAFTLVQPEFIYIVINQISWTSNEYFLDGEANNLGMVRQLTSSPNIQAFAGSTSALNGNLAVGAFGIVRILFNGASSKLQVNETAATSGDFGADDMGGFTLGSQGDGTANYSNIQAKEIIIRKIADTAPNEQSIYDYLAGKYSI